MLKSRTASITSKPLFIIVAESMVMRRPIFHVGCFSAWATVIFANSSRGVCRNGPPEAVSHIVRPHASVRRVGTGVWRCARYRWAAEVCLASSFSGDQLTGRYQAFLVRQPDLFASFHGFVRGFQPGHADNRAHHEIGFRMGGHCHGSGRAPHHFGLSVTPASRSRFAELPPRLRELPKAASDASAASVQRRVPDLSPRPRWHRKAVRVTLNDFEGAAANRAGGAQNCDSFHAI